jgi:predicted DNA-binding transcriptional regulator YafY
LKIDRLLAITMLLLNRRRVGAKELSERFEVSLRTIYRDLESINQSGIPIVSYPGADGGYEIMDQYRLDRQLLSLEELQSIILALKSMQPSLEEQDIGGLMDKVGALMSKSEQGATASLSQQIVIDLNPWHGGHAEKEKLSIIKNAVRDTKLIRFAYTNSQGEDSQRVCEPMGIVLKRYIWYLHGYCQLRKDFRIFRLSRIEHLIVLSEAFERRDLPAEQLDFRWSRSSADRQTVRLVLQFTPRAKARIQDYFTHGEIVLQPDGTLLVTAVQPEEPWLEGMLLSYGPDVKIIEPQSVAQAVLKKAQEIVQLYQKH